MTADLVPAAQYLRMSTEHQQYSIENQAAAIERYAELNGFRIVRTYADPARRGVTLKRRLGLQQLLQDAISRTSDYRAILVYDVSRWGRFLDADESAHYEYLCKSSGVPVHYCAEIFTNDGGMAGAIMKALKRSMAGEYSRELSVKVRAGQTRVAQMGYKIGGTAPLGLRRLLLTPDGKPKQILAYGERKSLATERVTLVPGPAEEIAIVKRIFCEFADEARSMNSIAERLNSEGIPYKGRPHWTAVTITHTLRQSKYIGMHIWGKTSAFLGGPKKTVSSEKWITCPRAFEPIISEDLFDRAQKRFAEFPCRLTDEELLDRLRLVLKTHGRLSRRLVRQASYCPSESTYRARFGNLLTLFSQIGFQNPQYIASSTLRLRLMVIRRDFIKKVLEQFPNQLVEVRHNYRFRSLLKYRRTGLLISIVFARHVLTITGKPRWLIVPPENERERVTILAMLNEDNTSIQGVRVFPRMRIPGRVTQVAENSKWLHTGTRLEQLSDMLSVVHQVRCAKI